MSVRQYAYYTRHLVRVVPTKTYYITQIRRISRTIVFVRRINGNPTLEQVKLVHRRAMEGVEGSRKALVQGFALFELPPLFKFKSVFFEKECFFFYQWSWSYWSVGVRWRRRYLNEIIFIIFLFLCSSKKSLAQGLRKPIAGVGLKKYTLYVLYVPPIHA